ncbi:RBM39 [Cordylochernes scorpioides]|uniref:RBM39 n=1 Tax=Cordylochernes scorpioides TaxID=51811 RepID=A0ABY6K637_9ARAC|nr:RBM39 [Cordylochernes scorpioides]
MQLSNRVKSRDLEEFFSSVGRVRDVKLIMDTKTRRSKGIAYIEFASVESVPLALALNGQKLLGIPIIVQPTQAEKNRAAATMLSLQKYTTVTGPMKLYVGNLHPNITKEMLKGIFDPFGKVENIEIAVDELGISKGYGYVSFYEVEDAKRALEQMNGFLLAEMELKVSHVTSDKQQPGTTNMLDADELERSGIDLGVTGRLQLMAKLAEGTGLQSFLLSNMFDPGCSTDQTYLDIYTEVVKECRPLGGALHVFVDKASQQGNVYVKCASVNATQLAVQYFHGRWVQGRLINAAYVTTENYHQLFPETAYLTTVL